MECGVCNYSWCWSCGLSTDSLFHEFTFEGKFCEFINYQVFGFDNDGIFKHKWLWIPVGILAIALVPPLSFLFALVFGIYILSQLLLDKYQYKSNLRKIKCLLHLITIVLSLSLGPVVGAVIWVFAAIYVVIISLAFLLLIIYRWCLKPRSRKMSKYETEII